MVTLAVPAWNHNTAELRELQSALAGEVSLRDGFAKPLRTIAGFDVGFEDEGASTRAAAVLLDADTLELLDRQVARLPTAMPYIPGLLSFRELPALFAALDMGAGLLTVFVSYSARMGERGLDAIVARTPDNVLYLTNFWGMPSACT